MMKLSEAIRLGATLRRQTRGGQLFTNGHGANKRSCALGATIDAIGLTPQPSTNGTARNRITGELEKSTEAYHWPPEWFDVMFTLDACPAACGLTDRIRVLIPHLNDTHRWTREQIADFVQAVESTTEPKNEPAITRIAHDRR